MLAYYITSMTGWLLIIMLVVTIIYPFLLRGGVLGPVQPFLRRMRFHYWLGYGISGIVLVHIWVSMSAGFARSLNAIGLDLATGAWLLIFLQVGLGLFLRQPRLGSRRLVRRWHLGVMIGLVVLVIGHVVLNSATLQMLVLR